MTTTDFSPGLERVLNNLEDGIKDVRRDIHTLEEKVDGYVQKSVTKEEFEAYQELRMAMEKETRSVRRSNITWAVTTIISVLLLIATAVSIIVTTRPDVVVDPTPESAIVQTLF